MTKYVRINGGSNANPGTEALPWETPEFAVANMSAGETLFIDSPVSAPWAPTTQFLDAVGLVYETWMNDHISVDGSGIGASTYVLRFDSVLCRPAFFRVFGMLAGKFAIRIHALCAGWNNLIAEDGAGAGITLTHTTNGTQNNVFDNTYRRLGSTGVRLDSGLSVTFVLNETGCRSYDNAAADRIRSGIWNTTDTINVSHGTTITETTGSGTPAINVDSVNGKVNILGKSSVILGGGLHSASDTMTSVGDITMTDGVITWPVLDSAPFTRDVGDNTTLSTTTKGGSGDIGRIFLSSRRDSCVVFVRDDVNNYLDSRPVNTNTADPLDGGSFTTWMDLLEAHGFRGSNPLTTRENNNAAYMQPGDWANIDSILARGHEICTHGSTGYHVNNVQWLNIEYTGTGSCTVTISGNTMTSTGVDDPLNIDLTSLQNNGLSSVINTLTAWTCSVFDPAGASPGADVPPASILADVAALDVTTAKILLQDNQRAYEFEYLLNRQDIVANTATSHGTKCHVYSAGSYNSVMSDSMESSGLWNGGRLGAAPNSDFGSTVVYKFPGTQPTYDTFQSQANLNGVLLNRASEPAFRRSVEAFVHWAQWTGAMLVFYGHQFGVTGGVDQGGFANTELSEEEWDWLFDTVKNTGITNRTLGDAYDWALDLVANPVTNAQDDTWPATLFSGQPLLTLPFSIGTNNGPLFSATTAESLATIEASGFFNDNVGYASLLKTDDVLIVEASDGTKMYTVTVNKELRIVTLSTGLVIA